jgi:diguanylate cyclase (GGDEF)-like protein
MIPKQLGIGSRIARLVALATFFAVIIAAVLQTTMQLRRDIEQEKQALQSIAFALASATGEAVENQDRAKATTGLTAVSRIPTIVVASIQTATGETLASMGQTAFLDGELFTLHDSNLAMLTKGYLPVSVDIIKGGKICGKLFVLGDIRNLRRQVFMTLLSTFAAALIAAIIGVLASKPLQRRIVGPLTEITNAIQNIRRSRNYSSNLPDQSTNDEAGILVKAFNSFMSDIRFRDNALQQLAYNDPLTGLPNRVSFQRTVDEHLEQRPDPLKGGILLMNIHGFRSLNDAFSHSIGDAILMTVAATIKSALRDDATLARYGGDEFALLLRDLTTEGETEMAFARIQSLFSKPLQIGELELHVSLTCGALILSGEPTSNDALRHVDLALAEAKNMLSGRVQFFRPQFAESVEQDTALGQALRQATRDNAFELHYQLQFDLTTNLISGFEALLRWKHATRGNISPAVFIPLAERIGLVSVIGDWVLQEGCRQAAEWRRMGQPDRVMSVNVSLAQILAAGFVEKVRSALRKSGLPPRLLCVELTESIFAGARYADIILILETLAKDGVKLALDDFGTGYSSLGYLSKLPFHTIKIDRSFVTDSDKSTRKGGMLKSIVEMVHALDMRVVAEGAETEAELALLRHLNVNTVQGYVVARPTPAEAALREANRIDQRQNLLSVTA